MASLASPADLQAYIIERLEHALSEQLYLLGFSAGGYREKAKVSTPSGVVETAAFQLPQKAERLALGRFDGASDEQLRKLSAYTAAEWRSFAERMPRF